MIRIVVVLFVVSVISGCSTYAAARYSISTDNVVALRALNGKMIAVGAFTSWEPGLSEITCRGVGPIKTPDGEPFSEFIRKALIDELRIANVYAASAPITLSGRLDNINFSSSSGTWELAMTITSSNGKVKAVSENYSYKTSYYGETACNQTAQALMPAVQDLVGQLVRSPDFSTLVQ